jgi:hypothetical protein
MQETEKPVTVLHPYKSEPILILLVHLGLIFFGQLLLVVTTSIYNAIYSSPGQNSY